MELMKGFKRTEIGIFPESWDIVRLDKYVIKVGSGITPKGGSSVYKESGRPFIRSQNVGWGLLKLNDIAFIDEETHASFSATEIATNDVLLNITGASIGRCALATSNVIGGNVNQHVCIIRTNNKLLEATFLCRVLLSCIGQKQIESFQAGGNREGLNFGQIKSFNIPLPPTKSEQTAIANALSDADAWIQSLSNLIAKKRQIKQGAMQTLLNPYENGRLKEGWVVKKMPDICWYQEGPGVRNSQFTKAGVKLLNGTNIENGKLVLDKTNRYISENEAYGWYRHFLADEGDILIACSGITVEKFHEKVTVLSAEHLPICMNTSTMRFKVNSKHLLHSYLIYFLRSKLFKDQISGKATGSAQLNFGPSHVDSVEVFLPLFNDQSKISTILSDMDSEITSLEIKLSKAQQIKQGMMQNLLTGRIRLL